MSIKPQSYMNNDWGKHKMQENVPVSCFDWKRVSNKLQSAKNPTYKNQGTKMVKYENIAYEFKISIVFLDLK